MNTEIFIPVFYMVLLTFTVSLIGTIVRFKNVLIDKNHSGSEMMKFSLPSSATEITKQADRNLTCLLYTSPSPRDRSLTRMPSSA